MNYDIIYNIDEKGEAGRNFDPLLYETVGKALNALTREAEKMNGKVLD